MQQREMGADCILRGDFLRKALNINYKLLSQINIPDLFTVGEKKHIFFLYQMPNF